MGAFKRGSFVIAKWKKDCGNEIDMCVVKADLGNSFTFSKMLRIKKLSVENISSEKGCISKADYRYEFNWRIMTIAERNKYFPIIMKSEWTTR